MKWKSRHSTRNFAWFFFSTCSIRRFFVFTPDRTVRRVPPSDRWRRGKTVLLPIFFFLFSESVTKSTTTWTMRVRYATRWRPYTRAYQITHGAVFFFFAPFNRGFSLDEHFFFPSCFPTHPLQTYSDGFPPPPKMGDRRQGGNVSPRMSLACVELPATLL